MGMRTLPSVGGLALVLATVLLTACSTDPEVEGQGRPGGSTPTTLNAGG